MLLKAQLKRSDFISSHTNFSVYKNQAKEISLQGSVEKAFTPELDCSPIPDSQPKIYNHTNRRQRSSKRLLKLNFGLLHWDKFRITTSNAVKILRTRGSENKIGRDCTGK